MRTTTDQYLLISSDGHAGPPAELYRDYLDPTYRPAFDDHQAEMSALRELASSNEEFREEWEAKTGDGGLLAAFDSDARNEKLDGEGVAAEVLFPDADVLGTGRVAASPFGSGLSSSGDSDRELVLAGAKAHNRWLADFCAKEPDRRIGVAVVPIVHDIDAAIAEIRDGSRARFARRVDPDALDERAGLPRASIRARVDGARGARNGPAHPLRRGTGRLRHRSWLHGDLRHRGVLVGGETACGCCSGPACSSATRTSSTSIAENGAWWLPDLVAKMDEKYVGGHNTKKLGNVFRENLSMKPSEYIDRNCFLAASTPGVEDIGRRHQVGVGNLLWGNDFPHPEGTFPYTRELVRQRFKDVPRDEAQRILGLNAVDLYGIDVAALARWSIASVLASTRSTANNRSPTVPA